MQKKRLVGIIVAAAVFLLIPLIAMQFTNEVKWNLFDFAVAAILLLALGFVGEYILRKVNNIKPRIALCVAVLVAFALIWAELAVGIFGTPFAGS